MHKVLMIAAENDVLPNGKVGGVGDVVRDVPLELANQGHCVDVITPSYGFHANDNPSTLNLSFDIEFSGKIEKIDLYKLNLKNTQKVNHWVIESDVFALYGSGIYFDDGHQRPFASDATKFALFCAALAELLVTHWQDRFSVVHLHDWHAAILAILREFEPKYHGLKKLPFVYTIHNLALQGIRPFEKDPSSLNSWFPALNYQLEKIQDPRYQNCFNPVRAGINLSDKVHVVSPTYAKEILQPSNHEIGFIGGEGLENDLRNASIDNRLKGIINGCDYTTAAVTKLDLSTFYKKVENTLRENIEDVELKAKTTDTIKSKTHRLAFEKIKLWQTLPNNGPLLTSVGRVTSQKVSLLVEPKDDLWVLDSLLKEITRFDGRFILLGSGDGKLESQLTQVMSRHNNFLFLNGYWQPLSDQLYQLGDLFIMPSSFEPCGISQMIAMRFGQPCLVHDIGGLHDTVKHLESGFSFKGDDIASQSQALIDTLSLALDMNKNKKSQWQKIKRNALAQRFDWQSSVEQYVSQLYN
ncbi:glycogen synthase [Aliikangiella marina]|uniref:starch synthase n=1 Tax=Aliikangiella marina TaxID=1712262 RepID=A0A545TK50_9GAMM|nr:glycogen synthase [Aliikangiella marina]